MGFETTGDRESHWRGDVVSKILWTFISDTHQARHCCTWKYYRPSSLFYGINYFRKKKYFLWISAVVPLLRVQKPPGRLERWIHLKTREAGNVAFIKSRAYSVLFRVSLWKHSRQFSCCSIQLWGKKMPPNLLFWKEVLRFTQSH